MNTTLCRGALALALLGGVALISAPAQAGSLQDEGDFGGTWTSIAPSDHYHQRYAGPVFGPFYYGPAPYAYYDPGLYAYYGPPVSEASDAYDYGPLLIGGPGIGLAIGID
jgi:hypothetical protein